MCKLGGKSIFPASRKIRFSCNYSCICIYVQIIFLAKKRIPVGANLTSFEILEGMEDFHLMTVHGMA